MALLRWLCAQTLLSAALIAGTCFARIFLQGDDQAARSKLRVQTAKQAADNSYGLPPCTPGTPQFPNYIQPIKVDPARMMGKWYLYEAWFDGISDTRATVNIVISISNLLIVNGSLTLYPGSNTQAIAMEQMFGTFAVADNQCNTVTQTFLDYLTVDGQIRGLGFSSGVAAVHTSLIMSTDYETQVILFECDIYDTNSGICVDAYPHVYTRDRPDKVSATTANNIVNGINLAFGPYCFTADLMKKYPWVNDMPECPLIVSSDSCYVSVRNAYLYLGDPNFTG